MILARHLSHYLITYYLPSGLFVVVSWISFLIPPEVRYCPVIGYYKSCDLNTDLLLVNTDHVT